ncbi:MAG: hypothetical protein QM793_04000 [Muricomes sp.]
MEVLARFANEDEKLDESRYEEVTTELGQVYLPQRGIAYSDTIKLGISKFLWMPRIIIEGANVA